MGSLARKVQRNQLKQALEKEGIKRTMPLSKYRFKTKEEKTKERAEKLTEQMLEAAKEAELNKRKELMSK